MAHVRSVARKDGGTAYEVRWRDHGAFKQRSFETEKAADRFAIEVELEAEKVGSTTHMARRGKPFREVAEAALAASTRLAPKTRKGYEDALRLHIYPTFADRPINQITSVEVEAWLTALQSRTKPQSPKQRAAKIPPQPYAASSIRGTFIALTKVFRYALRHRLIVVNPCTPLDKPRVNFAEQSAGRAYMPPDEVQKVADALMEPYGLIVRMAAWTGLRQGELAALRIRDVNLLRGHVEVRRQAVKTKDGWTYPAPKSARSTRDVPLTPSLKAELSDFIAAHPHKADRDALLFPGRRKGGAPATRAPLDYDRQINLEKVYSGHFRPALKRLGLPAYTWHDLRHFYASACAAAGIDIRKVSRWMGHASLAITMDTYTTIFVDSAGEDMAALDVVADAAPQYAAPIPIRRGA